MCDALRELMKDDLEDARKMGESEGEVRGEAKIILKMNRSGMSPENIASITGKQLKNKKLKLGLKYFSPCPIYIASKQGEPVAYPHKTNL